VSADVAQKAKDDAEAATNGATGAPIVLPTGRAR